MLFDRKVRFVGDRVALVAAETPEQAQAAVQKIKVTWEVLAPVLDPEAAISGAAPVIHDEPDATGIHDAGRNHAAAIAVGFPADRRHDAAWHVEKELGRDRLSSIVRKPT